MSNQWQFKTADALRNTAEAVRRGNLTSWEEIVEYLSEHMPEPKEGD